MSTEPQKPAGYQIPAWCHLPLADHYDGVGGCWGISHGFVKEQGETYCLPCEYHCRNPGSTNSEE